MPKKPKPLPDMGTLSGRKKSVHLILPEEWIPHIKKLALCRPCTQMQIMRDAIYEYISARPL